jgi:hypothetical protein
MAIYNVLVSLGIVVITVLIIRALSRENKQTPGIAALWMIVMSIALIWYF